MYAHGIFYIIIQNLTIFVILNVTFNCKVQFISGLYFEYRRTIKNGRHSDFWHNQPNFRRALLASLRSTTNNNDSFTNRLDSQPLLKVSLAVPTYKL